tara:strand:- start:4195 stop:5559 length:1365 start_codon:yes stop_codon:yes gene_type:complete
MKKLITYSILALSIGATAQTLQRDVVASMGDTQTNGNVTLSYTVGQPISGVVGESNKLSQGFQQNTVAYQDIELREGWGMASARVRPYDSKVDDVFSEVVNSLEIAKDNSGSVYMPEFGFNGIGDWDFFQGYQYKMIDPYTLTVRGSRVVPELNEMTLVEGWNLMSYLRKDPADIAVSMSDIADQLVIVKDEDGAVYMPEYGFNGIGNFNQGIGYQVKTLNEVTFTYTPNNEELRLEQNNHSQIAQNTKRFARPVNTGSNHTVMILETAWEDDIREGDELAAYDKEGNMVGSITLQQGHNAIAVWGDDDYTEEKEGLATGEVFSLVLYKGVTDEMVTLKAPEYDRGSNVYVKDGLTVITGFQEEEVITQEMELFQNVPNPVRSNTEIGFFLPEDTKATVTLVNKLGQEYIIADGEYISGYHSVNLERENLQAGMYFYSLKTPEKILTKQLTLIE